MPSRKLSTYRKKRDFEQTAEPSGDVQVAPSEQRRFVIQKHAATRLHYDLRLEFDGVFKSWAVTRGPSLDPHDKRLAVEVEDHPLDYGDFEGTIPKDQYGGGTVQLWDRGYWDSDDPERGFKKGDLKFNLHGDKLHGSWVLVRMRHDRNGGKRTNWLLIKHRDEYAKEGEDNDVLEEDRSVASGRTMKQIADGKGKAPKPFMTAKNGKGKADAVWHSNRGDAAEARAKAKGDNKPKPARQAQASRIDSIPDFVAPQLCTSVERPPSGEGWGHEIKFDGYRVQLRVEDGKATLKTRKGLDWTDKFKAIAKEGSALPDVLIDGEIVALDHDGNPNFSALQAAISDGKTDKLIFFAFDLLFAEDMDLRKLPLRERKARLKELLDEQKGKSIRYVEHFEVDGEAVLKSAAELKLEGIVSKKLERALSFRPHRKLDQGQGARRPGGRDRRLENHQWQIPLADGRRLSRRSSGFCRHGRHRFRSGHGEAHHAGAEGGGLGRESVRRQECAAQDPRRALAEARARRRDRIRRLDRRRQYPSGRLQGPARRTSRRKR